MDDDTDSGGYFAHSTEISGTVRSNASPASGTWRNDDSAHEQWNDGSYSFSGEPATYLHRLLGGSRLTSRLLYVVSGDGNLVVTPPADDPHYFICEHTFTRATGTLNGKRIWSLIVDQHSLYYDVDDYGIHPTWKVNVMDYRSSSANAFAQVVAEAEAGQELAPRHFLHALLRQLTCTLLRLSKPLGD